MYTAMDQSSQYFFCVFVCFFPFCGFILAYLGLGGDGDGDGDEGCCVID